MNVENWTFGKAIVDGEHYEIDGLNIWEHQWTDTRQHVTFIDPIYGQTYIMSIYEIHGSNKLTRFAAGEFSNCVWGIYLSK